MIGAIIGDIVGSPYESDRTRTVENKNFFLFSSQSTFTDDTVLTCATMDTILHRFRQLSIRYGARFGANYLKWAVKYPGRGYGSGFKRWIADGGKDINNSYANGCMMRCGPIGLYYKTLATAREKAVESIQFTHNSPESERGVQSIVSAIYLANSGCEKQYIQEYVEENFGHMLDLSLDQLRERPKTTIRCNTTAQQALICFMKSISYEDAIRNAVYTRGDTDTIAAIAGAIAEAFYGIHSIPLPIIAEAKKLLPQEMIDLVNKFYYTIGERNEQYRGFQI